MNSNARPARINLTHDLPARAQRLAPESVAQVFGGCIGEWQVCSNNWDCCSNKCLYHEWLAQERRYVWKCLPSWAT